MMSSKMHKVEEKGRIGALFLSSAPIGGHFNKDGFLYVYHSGAWQSGKGIL